VVIVGSLDSAVDGLELPIARRDLAASDFLAPETPILSNEWRELPPLLPEAPNLPEEYLPETLRPWLGDIGERMQVALEMVAVPAIVGLSSVIGRRVAIYPKSLDDWQVIPNLWGGVVARPGKMKTPALTEALKPIKEQAAKARQVYEDEMSIHAGLLESSKAKESAIKDLLRQAHKGKKKEDISIGQLEEDLSATLRERQALEIVERRLIVNDSTVEKLGELLAKNPNGVLLERDELAGWLRSLERDDRRGDREFFLEAWNGSNLYTVDRIGRGTIHIPALCVSVIGGIQPGKLSRYVSDALEGGFAADGLLQRLQLLVWPEDTSWRWVDRPPDGKARDRVLGVFESLDKLPIPVDGQEAIPLRFTPEAQDLFNAWLTELEKRLCSAELVECPAFESHLSKYRSLMPSLAAVFHLVELGPSVEPISMSAASKAASWCEFLEQHAKKVFAPELQKGVEAAHALNEKIRKGLVEDGMTVRDLYRKGWSRLSTADRVDEALLVLQECGRLRIETDGSIGRPSQIVRIHAGAGLP